jgi:hypothetical protein
MKRILAGFALWLCLMAWLSGCNNTPTVTAECGLQIELTGNEDTLEGVAACQHAAIKFGLVTCESMARFRVEFRDTDTWIDEAGESVAGVTYCSGVIQVGSAAKHPAYSGALIHEFRHIQDCPWSVSHEGWKGDGGVFDTIEQARYAAAEEDGRPVWGAQ